MFPPTRFTRNSIPIIAAVGDFSDLVCLSDFGLRVGVSLRWSTAASDFRNFIKAGTTTKST